MKIQRAAKLGLCFGVRRALALVEALARRRPIAVLGELVHNPILLDRLRRLGVPTVHDPAESPTRVLVGTAHGISQRRILFLRSQGFEVIDAACPRVKRLHQAVAALAAEGFCPVLVGRRGHPEVEAVVEDFDQVEVAADAAEMERLPRRARWGVAAQTTHPRAEAMEAAEALRRRFPEAEVRFVDTTCPATEERQAAGAALAEKSDAMVVVGGSGSNNTRKLAAACARLCPRVFHVEGPEELRREWFRAEDRVGLAAGTSTPMESVHAVEARLRRFAWELERTAARPAGPVVAPARAV
ncbi:MAG: 4-hydroxy-3-methylbut-2-enyl diphosphate reductase [Verrucomicrobia bacterium]|nr:4-hydroxy-3-methylbut-2-enyl diphosphate reductase [Verrucomicrobiota bacterium]